jgi:hypothetical protein
MQEKHGRADLDFLPETYCIPEQYGEFVQSFKRLSKDNGSEKNLWIVKPTNLSRGRGIYIIDNIQEVKIDTEDPLIVCRYIQNPLLINGHKFDLRIYVVVTSYEPLRLYVHQEGLARFATEQYTTADAKSNIFNHLTNYSINKNHHAFVQNDNLEEDD